MRIIKASEGRCIAAHFGTYDYTASCGITAKYQTMSHPVCDFAHHMTKVALAGTGIFLVMVLQTLCLLAHIVVII